VRQTLLLSEADVLALRTLVRFRYRPHPVNPIVARMARRPSAYTKHTTTFRDRAPWWGGDLQTLRNFCFVKDPQFESRSWTQEFLMSDGSGDRLTGTLEEPSAPRAGSPLIVLIHGLTGCEDSHYMRACAKVHLARGRTVLRLNLRGAGPSRQVAKGYYHAGLASDIRDVLDSLEDAQVRHGVFAIGFSLGGNILLNLLGRLEGKHRLIGAATVSAPIEPDQACERIMAPRNALYHRFLLTRMKRDVLPSPALSEEERRNIQRADSVFAFDDIWVAPRNGFSDAHDYYARTAGARVVGAIAVPTLMLHARNDPWIPTDPYLALQGRDLPNVTILVARSGGHLGFHERGHAETWHDRTIDAFIRDLMG